MTITVLSWIVGQLVACGAAALIGQQHGFPIGFAVFWALSILVDIRGYVSK